MRDDLRSGAVVAGRYRIRRAIGQGGMGAVYEAEQLTLGRTVARKILFDDDVPSSSKDPPMDRGARF